MLCQRTLFRRELALGERSRATKQTSVGLQASWMSSDKNRVHCQLPSSRSVSWLL